MTTRWDVTPAEAREQQATMRTLVRQEPLDVEQLELVAGADLSMERFARSGFAGVVVLELPSLGVVERAVVEVELRFPYVPGLLSWRETPAVLEAWSRLQRRPQALIVDGHGFAHPRRFGIACHLGVLLDLPTVGCGKTVLTGKYEEPAAAPGSWSPLMAGGEVIGAAVRTRAGAKPVFVSVGHRVTLADAVRLVARCTRNRRIPETTLQAHNLVNEVRRNSRPQPSI